MEDVLYPYREARVADIKLGSRLDAPDYDPQKAEEMIKKAAASMHHRHGYQLCGLATRGSESRTVSAYPRGNIRETVADEMTVLRILDELFREVCASDSSRADLKRGIRDLNSWFVNNEIGIIHRGASILLVIMRDRTLVRLIDFGHAYFYYFDLDNPRVKQDYGVLIGMDKLEKLVEGL